MTAPHSRRRFLQGLAATSAAVPLLAELFPFRSQIKAAMASLPANSGGKPFGSAREDYDLARDVLYLNHASIGTMPRLVRKALQGYIETCETNPWYHIWGDAWEEAHDRTRQKAAAFMGCRPEELTLTHNTTEGFNILAAGLPLGKGDEVLFSSLNHSGASACWFHQSEAMGYDVKTFDMPLDKIPNMTEAEILAAYEAHINPRTRVLVFPHIDNTVGLRHPVKALTALARARGVGFVAVDGAQALGMLPIDVADLGVDVYAVSAHKWLQAPKGRGMLYVRKESRDAVRPMWVTWGQKKWGGDARKYEDYGTRNLPAILAVEDALDFQIAQGAEAKEAHYRKLWDFCRTRVGAMPHVTWLSPLTWERATSLYAIGITGKSSKETAAALFREHGIVLRPFEARGLNSLRVSPNTLNSLEELERFFQILQKMVG